MDLLGSAAKIASILGVLAAVSGGIFAFWKFHIFSEKSARLTLKVDLIPRLRHQDFYICEVIADIENVGNVGVQIERMTFALHGLQAGDAIDEKMEKLNYQVRFPRPIKRGTWLPGSYVEPKSSQQYSHVCAVPVHFAAVLAFGRIEYSDSDQTAQKVVVLRSAIAIAEQA